MEKKPRHRRARTNFLLAVVISSLACSLATAFVTQNYLWRIQLASNNSSPRALLADPLSLNYPNPSFVSNLTNALVGAGYHVDYWGASSTAVDQFRQLPADGYDLIIIRSHIGSSQSIITAQPYSPTEYTSDQIGGALVPAVAGSSSVYFALTARFVRQEMAGRFPQSTIVVMGCSSLQGSQDLATAFLDKGATYFVGWDATVSIIHTDKSTVALAEQLSQGRSVPEATRMSGSADPLFGAKLGYLDWKTLVQSRIDDIASKFMLWAILAGLLVFGPATVFAVPRLFNLFDRIRERRGHRVVSRSRPPQEKP